MLPFGFTHDTVELLNFPLSPSWKEATIVRIAKPGKDSKDPNNYHPIASTS